MIYYYCPLFIAKTAGGRRLFRHIDILVKAGIPAAILVEAEYIWLEDMPLVPMHYLTRLKIQAHDIFVFPEGALMPLVRIKKICIQKHLNQVKIGIIALNLFCIYRVIANHIEGYHDWKSIGIDFVLTNSKYTADFVSWAMRLPTYVVKSNIDPEYFFFEKEKKRLQIIFIHRKKGHVQILKRVLASRNKAFVEKFIWKGLEGLSINDYAQEVRASSIFLNLSLKGGFPTAGFEAMRSGTIYAGYNAGGGKGELIGDGDNQNCILAENDDYVALAQKLEPLLLDLIQNNAKLSHNWQNIIANGLQLSDAHNPKTEQQSVLDFWAPYVTPDHQPLIKNDLNNLWNERLTKMANNQIDLTIQFITIGNTLAGSSRIRVFRLLQYFPNNVFYKVGRYTDLNCDILFIQKIADQECLDLAAKAKVKGIKVVYDIDDDFGVYKDMDETKMCKLADLIITDMPERAAYLNNICTTPIKILPPALDYLNSKEDKIALKDNMTNLVSFGNLRNILPIEKYFDAAPPHLNKYYIGEVILQFNHKYQHIHWDLYNFINELKKFDLCILVHPENDDSTRKSNNRLVVCMALGLPTIVSKTNSYYHTLKEIGLEFLVCEQPNKLKDIITRLEDPITRQVVSEKFRDYAWAHYAPRKISSQLLALLR